MRDLIDLNKNVFMGWITSHSDSTMYCTNGNEVTMSEDIAVFGI